MLMRLMNDVIAEAVGYEDEILNITLNHELRVHWNEGVIYLMVYDALAALVSGRNLQFDLNVTVELMNFTIAVFKRNIVGLYAITRDQNNV